MYSQWAGRIGNLRNASDNVGSLTFFRPYSVLESRAASLPLVLQNATVEQPLLEGGR